MESLIETHRNKWSEFRDLYSRTWPDGAVPFCFLDTLITYPDIADSSKFKVYAPDGDMNNGMIAICDQENYYELKIHPLENIDKIEAALATTKIIDWNKNMYVASADTNVEGCLKGLSNILGIELNTDENRAVKHFLDRHSKKFDISSCPPNTYVANLRAEFLQIVAETWAYYSETSYKFFEALARNNLCYVLYSSKDDSPLAWVTISNSGSLTHLYCLEEHRRKGYAEFVLKFATNDQLNKGKDILGYTVANNVKAQKLFDKLNFERIGCDTWIFIKKADKS